MTILVTRPSPAGDELVTRLRATGRAAWALPLIEFTPGHDLAALPHLIAGLQAGDLLFALSQHAVSYAQPALDKTKVRWPATVDYYAIGRRTALALHSVCARPVVWPEERETSEILIQLPALQNVAGKQALILRGNGGRELLATTLTERGATVKLVECYQRCAKHYDGAVEGKRWRERNIATLVVTSGDMLQQLYQLFPEVDREEWLLHCRLIVISARLATLARESGWRDITVAEGADNDALLRALQ
ncbi:uroporphyrinogen-III synthase [Erwinia sp. OLTSP20]|uniref:uroporphyrinogen-III synthase n=1 Tax=unclassified Erwinia TaxID=2622719 RepID=UPI000C1A26C5|nr:MULTISPECIES: uroporphyrinogen-III synthase [unclassified Erwinia]PIJ50777.1 uroporphyrinogen-III synthase [Erwinia sp. OAMSP11]PIJ72929.1 uroporphyrinogen-III synthase [Erwinia sp. OLSSP12]PIJ81944.1 uroporphyrinogen-III synthase [Erwinia sp. OLCASP19]PIJ84599.1 uroporphyrinogen-III synthase [Erwinia sp. OLMTSP26]PIJ86946.1 uroporphyrinogen-III synthase [Erwinia sp. OLMDSP33]